MATRKRGRIAKNDLDFKDKEKGTVLRYIAPHKQFAINTTHSKYQNPGYLYPWLYTTLTPINNGTGKDAVIGHYYTAQKLTLRFTGNVSWPTDYIGVVNGSQVNLSPTTTYFHIIKLKTAYNFIENDDDLTRQLFTNPPTGNSDFNHDFLQANKAVVLYSGSFSLGMRVMIAAPDLEWLCAPPQIWHEDVVIDLPNISLEVHSGEEDYEYEQIMLASSTRYWDDDWSFSWGGNTYSFTQISDDGVDLHVNSSILYNDA